MSILKNMGRINNRSGFSLMEVITASIIFAIAVVGVFMALASIKKPADASRRAFSDKRRLHR